MSSTVTTASDILRDRECGRATCICHASAKKGHGLTHCPAHDDAHPSFNVDEGPVYHCKSGCSQEQATEALRRMGMMGGEGTAASTNGSAANGRAGGGKKIVHRHRYPILTPAGELVSYHERIEFGDGTKRFVWLHPDGTASQNGSIATAAQPLYGVHLLAKTQQMRVILVEGEKAADALLAANILALGTVTGAASTPSADALCVLSGYEVLLWPDNDDSGRKHMERIAEALRTFGVVPLFINWREAPPKGDAADFIQRHPEREALIALIGSGAPSLSTEEGDPEGKRYRPAVINARDLWVKTFPEPKWAVPGIVPDGITILAGKPKLGKSWWAFNVSCAIALGGIALGMIPVEQGSVLYLDVDSKSERRLKDRLAINLLDAPKPPNLYFATEWPRFGEQQGECHLEDWLGEHLDTRLVVIDTFVKARKRTKSGLNPYEADTDAMEIVRNVGLGCGVSILLVHHTTKAIPLDDPMDAIMGSMGITSSSDCNLILERTRGESDAVLHRSGRDLVDDESLAMDFDTDRALWVVKGSAAEFAITKERKEIIKLMVSQARPMSAAEIAEGLGKKRTAIANLCTKMVGDGLLQFLGGGRYAPVGSSS